MFWKSHSLICGAFLVPWLAFGPLVARAQSVAQLSAGDLPINRPLRYTPIGTDFVITNGTECFNRPLYGGSSPFRVDGGDQPEFSLYLPGRGGNLRLGVKSGGAVKWLNAADQVVTRYRPGSLIHEIHDSLLGPGTLQFTTLALTKTEGLIIRVEWSGTASGRELVWAVGGVNGAKGRRDGDIGCETEPVGRFFQLRAEQCAGNSVRVSSGGFQVCGRPGTIAGILSAPARLSAADAADWNHPEKLFAGSATNSATPVLIGQVSLPVGQPFYLGLQRLANGRGMDETLDVYREVAAPGKTTPAANPTAERIAARDLPDIFAREENLRQALADRVKVETPDAYVNAAAAALNVAADAVWDDRQEAYLHGAVAWRTRLLGWRVSYAGDALGWHDRTARHFDGFARQQNTQAIPPEIPPADARANLARNEAALHSNGDLSQSHYDMNLVAVDGFFRHLLWTGDLAYARRLWPVIERHLAWERRLFRREFGSDKLPLYEAYCCIWASDDLAYNGGGATHSSAYNLYHNRMAARVAKMLGRDPGPYEQEADLIARGMRSELWLPDRGWFAEWKDLLGLQLVHPNAALWTFYHTLDSEVPSPAEAWQMSRFVDTQMPHIPVGGPDVPEGCFTLPTTSWMPYTWSLNNVVMAESTHTALAYWQANRPDPAFALFKGALLDSMYLGLCPGNVGMCTWFDANRRESQRDFGDGSGATSRALVEGLFGVHPDLLAGEVLVRPGFPTRWDHASMRHPDFNFSFKRQGSSEIYSLKTSFPRAIKLRLQIRALLDGVASVQVNGQPASWRMLEASVGTPMIEIEAAPAKLQSVAVLWSGQPIAPPDPEHSVVAQSEWSVHFAVPLKISELSDPQNAWSHAQVDGQSVHGIASGALGHRTVFARVGQGSLRWWQPIAFEIVSGQSPAPALDWHQPVSGNWDTVDMTPFFNDRVTQIFRSQYLSPRSPYCSLAAPQQGIGSWCHPGTTFDVDDSGLRQAAGKAGGKIALPNGVPLATPGTAGVSNIVFVSRWDNYPHAVSVPLSGKSSHAFLLMAGSTWAMTSRFDNGEVVVTYADGSTTRLALHNPTTWWPIDQDYYIDDFAFARPEPLPVRVDLKTGRVRVLDMAAFKRQGRVIPGGAATVLDLPLDATKSLKSLTVKALANEVVIGLMSVTLAR